MQYVSCRGREEIFRKQLVTFSLKKEYYIKDYEYIEKCMKFFECTTLFFYDANDI